jgi:hypothetical protein
VQTIDTILNGVARPHRKVKISEGVPYWINSVEITGLFSEFTLWNGDMLLARENVSMEFPAPIYAQDMYITIESDQTCNYAIGVTRAKSRALNEL